MSEWVDVLLDAESKEDERILRVRQNYSEIWNLSYAPAACRMRAEAQ